MIDGRFYCPLADVVHTPFKTPFESAVQISDSEILAKMVIEYDDETVPCEVTFKYEAIIGKSTSWLSIRPKKAESVHINPR